MKTAHNVVRGPSTLAFASLALAVWEFHCHVDRIVVSPPGMAAPRPGRRKRDKVRACPVAIHWPILVCHLNCKGGWESGSLTWHIAVPSELEFSWQGIKEDGSWRGRESVCCSVLLPIIRQTCARIAHSFLFWPWRNRSGKKICPVSLCLLFCFTGWAESDCLFI